MNIVTDKTDQQQATDVLKSSLESHSLQLTKDTMIKL